MSVSDLDAIVSQRLFAEINPTQELIRETIRRARAFLDIEVSDEDAERLARSLEQRFDVSMSTGSKLVAKGYSPWLPRRSAEIDPYFWNRYKRLLIEQGRPNAVVQVLDKDTSNIVGLLEDPEREDDWDRRGMVVGHVQSGKTQNYLGVICKAADAGYKLIIVIAGVHNNLRSQTQSRIDEGFIGRDTGKGMAIDGQHNLIGVSKFGTNRRPVSFTNTFRDFNKQQANSVGVSISHLNEPAILVIKKNSSTLANLIAWLKDNNAGRGGGKIAAPMLLIDDEADNASINTAKGPGEVTRINGQIRTLLGLFRRRCYVGYTATPFANIFIDPETDEQLEEAWGTDLFPGDFIYSLDPPDDYFGARRVFLDDSDAIVRPIADNQDLLPAVHKIDHRIVGLPASLESAIQAFVLSRAIRILRGQGTAHSSMLVNASRFTAVQGQLRNEIQARVGLIRDAARMYSGLAPDKALANAEISALKAVWAAEYADCAAWEDIQPVLNEAASPINVVEVNARSKSGLDYRGNAKDGLHVIAVGGFSLSRGLTLEGLTVSYFLRNSLMYDTLMQMGRWFGYRPGYEDLCRVWMPKEAQGWYEHIAEATEELRQEFKRMEAVKATPRDFGLKVRSHPTNLIVTARNKMGTGQNVVLQIGLGNNFIETTSLPGSAAALRQNRIAAKSLVEDLFKLGLDHALFVETTRGRLVHNVPAEIVTKFIRSFVNSTESLKTQTAPVASYIEERADDELAAWDVLFASLQGGSAEEKDRTTLGFDVRCQNRTLGRKSSEFSLRLSDNHRLSSRGIEKIGVEPSAAEIVEEEYRNKDKKAIERKNAGKSVNYPDKIYRDIRKRPLLIIHVIKLDYDPPNESPPWVPTEPVVGWGISFPETQRPQERVTYVVGAVWLAENMPDDRDDDDSGGDDGE